MTMQFHFLGDGTGSPRRSSVKKWRALGAVSYDECMTKDPNFPKCDNDATTQAVLECAQIGSPDGCVLKRRSEILQNNCLPACEAYLVGGGGAYPWGVYSQATCDVQADINKALLDQGYLPIAADCKMGPRTCGAADAVGFGVPASCVAHAGTWIAPTKGTVQPPPAPPPPPVATASSDSGGSIVGVLLLAAAVVGAIALGQS